MRRHVLFVFLALLSGTAAHAEQLQLSISQDARGEWPFIGQVSHGYDKLGLCTGTLIAPDKVLTAAHCVVNPDSRRIAPFHRVRFRAGLHDGEEVASSFAARIDVHPRYLDALNDKATLPLDLFEYDVALVSLKHPMPQLMQAHVSMVQDMSGAVSVLGYQKDSKEVLVDYVGCAVILRDPRFLGLSCAVQSGTSGGPVLKQIDGEWQVAGVVVARTGTKRDDIKGVAVRIDQDRLPAIFPDTFR